MSATIYFKLLLPLCLLLQLGGTPVPCFAQAPASATTSVSNAGPWEREIALFEERDRVTPPRAGAVLFIGSSTIRLWKTLAADFPTLTVINRGFGGSHIADSLRYAERIITPYKPRLVIFYAGSNDIAAGKTPERVAADYRELVQKVHKKLPRTRFAYVSILPTPARQHLNAEMRRTNALIKDYVATDRRLSYIDAYPVLLGTDGKLRPGLYVQDQLHLNAEGYNLLQAAITKHLQGETAKEPER